MSKKENAESEARVAALKAELGALKTILRKVLNRYVYSQDFEPEIRHEWNAVIEPPPEEMPKSEPLPPQKGEAQENLETIIALEKVFGGQA